MFFDRLRVPMLPAAIIERKETQADGLLPASVFEKIHVDRTRGEIVLVLQQKERERRQRQSLEKIPNHAPALVPAR